MSLSPSISRYLSVQGVANPRFFADGNRLAFLADITGIPQAWQVVLPEPGNPALWPVQLTFEPERVQWVTCSPVAGDNRLIYARDAGGNEKAQLFLFDTDTGAETALTAGFENAMHIPGPWSEDGSFILYSATRRNPALFDAYIQPLDGEARMLWQHDTPGYLVFSAISPDQSRAVIMRMASSFDTELFEITLATGDVRQLTRADEPVRYFDPVYAPDGRSLYLRTDRDADFLYLARLDLDSGTWETIIAPEWDVDGLERSSDGRYLAYTLNVDGLSELYLLDLETGDTRQARALSDVPGIAMMMGSFHADFAPDSSRLAFLFVSAVRTSDLYIWDFATDEIYPVTRSSHGGLPVESFVAPELVHYPTFDQTGDGQTRKIPAWFYRPRRDTDDPVPVVVLVHGGPESQARPLFLPHVQYFLSNGYAVFVPNVRGSTGYGKAYSHLDDVEKRMDSVADLAYGAHWLKAQPGIDGDRLVVYGGSYGGFMVLSALTTYPDLWCVGVDIVGISSFVTFLENTSAYRREAREAEYGSLEHDREFLESVSPINHIDQITAPLMVIHGANDPRVPLSEAEQLVAALEARDVPVELLVFDDEGHGIIKLKNRLIAYPAIVDFLKKHVGQ